MKNLLTCDINRRIYMSYGSRQRCSKSRPAQSGSHPPPRALVPARGGRTSGPELVCHQAQAYRYLQRAQQLKRPVPVEDAKVSFTVKLSRHLVARLRTYAASTGWTLSEIVSRAVQSVLHRGGGRGLPSANSATHAAAGLSI